MLAPVLFWYRERARGRLGSENLMSTSSQNGDDVEQTDILGALGASFERARGTNTVETVTETINGTVVTFVRRHRFGARFGAWAAYEGEALAQIDWLGSAETLDAIRAHVTRTFR